MNRTIAAEPIWITHHRFMHRAATSIALKSTFALLSIREQFLNLNGQDKTKEPLSQHLKYNFVYYFSSHYLKYNL